MGNRPLHGQQIAILPLHGKMIRNTSTKWTGEQETICLVCFAVSAASKTFELESFAVLLNNSNAKLLFVKHQPQQRNNSSSSSPKPSSDMLLGLCSCAAGLGKLNLRSPDFPCLLGLLPPPLCFYHLRRRPFWAFRLIGRFVARLTHFGMMGLANTIYARACHSKYRLAFLVLTYIINKNHLTFAVSIRSHP